MDMDETMGPMDIPIQQGWITSKARIQGIEVHGISSMGLERTTMKRAEELDNLNMDITFNFDRLFINGTYRVEVRSSQLFLW